LSRRRRRRGRGRLRPRHRAEAVHGGHREIIAQPPLGGGGVEHVAGQRRHRGQRAEQRREVRVGIERVGDDHLVGVDARQRGAELIDAAFGDDEFRRRDVDPGEADAVAAGSGRAHARDRQQVVVGARVEQGVLGERAGGDQPHHVAAHHALVAALLRLRRILHLLAHRNAMAERDQPVQIVVGALHRHAAHRDVRAEMLAALGQRDAERARGGLSVLEEQFVEVAHPVEQQEAGIGRLDLEVLFHHRRDAAGRLDGGGIGHRRRGMDGHGGRN